MSDGKVRMGIIELIIAIISAAMYFMAKMNNSFAAFLSFPSASALLFQITLGILLIMLFSAILELYGRATKNERNIRELVHIFRLIAYPILVLVLLHTLSISISSLLVGAGFLGIIVGLAAQASLGNVFSGLAIMYSRPIKAGDKITFSSSAGMQAPSHPHELLLNGITGTVKNIGLIYTKIQRDDLTVVYVPNSTLNQELILNHSRNDHRQIRVRIEVKRNLDLGAFKSRLISQLKKQRHEFSKLNSLETKISLMNTEDQLGLIITAVVEVLDYERLSQWLAEESINAVEHAKGSNGLKKK